MLAQLLSDLSSARLLGARHVQFTVTQAQLAELAASYPGEPELPTKKESARRKRDHADAVLWVHGCPVYVGTTYSYAWM